MRYSQTTIDLARRIIGSEIRRRRQELGYSQAKLSELTGIRKATIIDVEKGRNFKSDTFIALMDRLGGVLNIQWA